MARLTNGGIVGKAVTTPTKTAAIGKWNTSDQHIYKQQDIWLVNDIVRTNLSLYLDAANTSSYPGSGNTWFDISGNGYNATLLNGITFSSSNGGSLVFDGIDDTASVSKPNPNISGTVSMCAMLKFDNFNSGPIVIHKGAHYTYQFRSSDGTDRWTYADSTLYNYSTFGYRVASGLYQTNTWMYVVVTKDSSNDVRIYKNASLLDTRTSFGSSIIQNNSTLWISGYSDNDNQPVSSLFDGNIASIQIYNKTLSLQEIQQNFDFFRGRYGL